MECPYCKQDIAPRAFDLHKRLCPKAPTNAPTTITPPVPPKPVSGPVQITIDKSVIDAIHDVRKTVVVPTVVPSNVDGKPETHDLPVIVTPREPEKPATVADVAATQPAPAVTPPHTNGNGGGIEVIYLKVDPYFIVSVKNLEALRVTEAMSHKKPTCLLITGHAGCGKTSIALQLGAIFKRPAVVADMGVIQEPQQLFQTTRLIQGKGDSMITDTRESGFVKGLETPNCIVVMDEMNRVENERCLNPLMPVLDNRRETWIDELRRRVHVADGVIFVATINEGALFCGINSLDGALRDRFREINLGYLPAEQESMVLQNKTGVRKTIADSLAQFAFTVRNTPAIIDKKISTRQLLHAAEAYAEGTTLWAAVETAIGNYNDPAWRQQVMEIFSLNIQDEEEHKKWLNRDTVEKWVPYV